MDSCSVSFPRCFCHSDRFKEKIRFLQISKNEKLDYLTSKSNHDVSDIVPLNISSYLRIKHTAGSQFKDQYSYKYWKSWQGKYIKGSHIRRKNLQSIMTLISNDDSELEQIRLISSCDIFWDQISKITKYQFEGYVYDLSVPIYESFICNNIVAHNTRELQLPSYL